MKNCLQNRLLSILNVFDIFFMQREILDTYVTHIHGNINRKSLTGRQRPVQWATLT